MAEDPFADKTQLEKILDERAKQFRNVSHVVEDIDNSLKYKIAQAVQKKTGKNVPDYDLIEDDTELQREIKSIIEDVYSLDYELSPLKDAVDKGKIDEPSLKLIRNIYAGHKNDVLRAVGTPRFRTKLNSIHNTNLEEVQKKLITVASDGYSPSLHGDIAYEFFKDKYKFKEEKVDKDLLKRQMPSAIGAYVQGVAREDIFYDIAPKLGKPESEPKKK